MYPVVGTFLGCWFGAIPLGLDWERPWQVGDIETRAGPLASCDRSADLL